MYWGNLSCRTVLKQCAIFYTEEKVNGTLFTHKRELSSGKQHDNYSIDGRAVDGESFEETLLNAHTEERRRERAQERDVQLQEYVFKHEAQVNLLQKLLKIIRTEIFQEIQKFEQYHLEPYCVFDLVTIANQQEYDMLKFNTNFDQLDISELEALYKKLEPYPDKLRKFSRNAIQRAIAECTDTKLLKELLVLVS